MNRTSVAGALTRPSPTAAPQPRGAALALLPIEAIRPSPYQPRRSFSQAGLVELSRSIRQMGLLQPISVRPVAGGYELIAGERRLRACRMAGLTHVNAIVVKDRGDADAAMLAMIENLQREDLHFFEEAEGLLRLMREHGLTQEELARRLGKGQSTIANKLRILRLPRAVKERICHYGLTERHARALLRLHDEAAQMALVEKIGRTGASVAASEAMIEEQLLALYGDSPDPPSLLRIRCGWRIYVSAIKKAVDKISSLGADAALSVQQQEGEVVVTVRIRS